LVLASSVIATPCSRDMLSANDNCAELGGLAPRPSPVFSPAPKVFFGACCSRNARQTDPDLA
jgi:hypothetical protein